MGWIKNRDRLHEAALSSIKSITKKKDLSSKNGIAQRPPSLNQATISSTPRSTKDYHHGEVKQIFNLFGIYFIKKKMTLP